MLGTTWVCVSTDRKGPSKRQRLKIQHRAQSLALGRCPVNTECFLKQISRGRVSVGTFSGFCRTPLTILKMLLCFLFWNSRAIINCTKTTSSDSPEDVQFQIWAKLLPLWRAHGAGLAPPTVAPTTDSQQEGRAPRQQQTEKFPLQLLAHPPGESVWGRRLTLWLRTSSALRKGSVVTRLPTQLERVYLGTVISFWLIQAPFQH